MEGTLSEEGILGGSPACSGNPEQGGSPASGRNPGESHASSQNPAEGALFEVGILGIQTCCHSVQTPLRVAVHPPTSA